MKRQQCDLKLAEAGNGSSSGQLQKQALWILQMGYGRMNPSQNEINLVISELKKIQAYELELDPVEAELATY
jgi:hypothetical protein